MKRILIAFIFIGFLNSCQFLQRNDTQEIEGVDIFELKQSGHAFQTYSVPTPVEVAAALKLQGMGYQEPFLRPLKRPSNYDSDFHRALNLGMYAVDYSYLSLFVKRQSFIYLGAMHKIAIDLKVAKAFREKVFTNYMEHSTNRDTLLAFVTEGYKRSYLLLEQADKKQEVIFVFTGTFVEGLHLLTNATLATKGKQKRIFLRLIREQNYYLQNIIYLLSKYCNETAEGIYLLTKLNEVKKIYGGLSMQQNSPGQEENRIKGRDFSDLDMGKIIALVKSSRNYILAGPKSQKGTGSAGRTLYQTK